MSLLTQSREGKFSRAAITWAGSLERLAGENLSKMEKLTYQSSNDALGVKLAKPSLWRSIVP
jgi:hypothetical protein